MKAEQPLKLEQPVVVEVVHTGAIVSDEMVDARVIDILTPAALRLKAAAVSLMLISILYCGSLEGLFGIMAAASVLCCAAPGAAGTARAARCTRICAIVCAALAFGNLLALTTFAFMVPHVPNSVAKMCATVPADAATPTTMPVALAPPKTEGKMPTTVSASAMIAFPASASDGADTIVAIAYTGVRKLREVAPSYAPTEVECEQVTMFSREVLPYVVTFGIFGELCLFIVAMTTAIRAAHLTMAYRTYAANAL